ncbi:MAG: HNH endonuclease [Rhodobacteraceae bacterium]|nr:HNH endonuclease [Paracoccaceae bacterium]
MKGQAISYSEKELAWIKAHKSQLRPVAHAQFCAKFRRVDVKLSNYSSLCKRNGWLTGRTGKFEPGQPALNKGKKMPFNPNSAKTQFKKGNLPHNTKTLGFERTSNDGYIEISVDQVNPHTGYERRFVHKHRHLWEQANGHLPVGMCLKSLDGDKTNTDPSNWEAIPRALLPRLNGRFGRGYDDAAPELKPTIMAITKLEHHAREAKKNSPEQKEARNG